MGLFRREPTIGRSNLTKSDLERLIDLDSDYRTDYTYVSSKSYRPDGSLAYENPRMFRLPIDSFRRKREFESAWKAGFIQYFYLCLLDFLRRFIANPAKVSGNIVGSIAFSISQGFWTIISLIIRTKNDENYYEQHHQQQRHQPGSHRHSFEREQQYSWISSDADADSRLAESVRRRSVARHSPSPFANEATFSRDSTPIPVTTTERVKRVGPTPSIIWSIMRRIGRLLILFVTLGVYPSDFGRNKNDRQRWSAVQGKRAPVPMKSTGAAFDEPFARSVAASLMSEQSSKSFTETRSSFRHSDEFANEQQPRYYEGPPPAYDETWEMREGDSGLAPRVSTPFGLSELRHGVSGMSSNEEAYRNEEEPIMMDSGGGGGVFGTFVSEAFTFLFTVCTLPLRVIDYYANEKKTVNHSLAPRQEEVYNLRSRSIRAPAIELSQHEVRSHQQQRPHLLRRTFSAFSSAATATAKSAISIVSSVVLAPIMLTTYLITTAFGDSNRTDEPSIEPRAAAVVSAPLSKSDYMVGRAFGIVADVVYAFLTGFLAFSIYVLAIPIRLAVRAYRNTVSFARKIFNGPRSSHEHASIHSMTTRAMSRGITTPNESVGVESRVTNKRYRRYLIWLIPLIAFLLLFGLFAKRCNDDQDVNERTELLQYPTLILGRTYAARDSIWTKVCALGIATKTAIHASQERLLTALASQSWTSKATIVGKFESAKGTLTNFLDNVFSSIRLRLLYVRNYLWSVVEQVTLIPHYIYDGGALVLNKIYELLVAIVGGIYQLFNSIWENLLPLLLYLRNQLQTLTRRWSEPISEHEINIPLQTTDNQQTSAFELGLEELRHEKLVMSAQLEQLRRERELDEERYRELRQAIELNHKPLETMSQKSTDLINEEILSKKIELYINNYITNLKLLDDSLINKRLVEMESRLLSRLEQLSARIEDDFNAKLGDARRESGDAQTSLSNEISDLASAIANQRSEFDMFRRERDAKLANLAHTLMVVESEQSEHMNQIKSQIKELITDEVAKGLNAKLTSVTKKSEHEVENLRDEIYKHIEARVMALFAAQLANKANEDRSNEGKTEIKDIKESNRFTESDLLVIRKLIVDALRVYDADKTGKVDYALETSGGSVISTRCTEAYKEMSRLESIFGIPLWYSSYSPRSVIQHRANALTSGECWAFRGVGYLTIKLSIPIYVTEVSYEHLRHELHPDGVMRSAPKKFEIWAYKELDDLDTKVLLGQYEFNRNGDALQFFTVQHHPPTPTPIIELVVQSNWGADYTCLYRFRVHGNKPNNTSNLNIDSGNDIVDDSPVVDHTLTDEFERGTMSANDQGL